MDYQNNISEGKPEVISTAKPTNYKYIFIVVGIILLVIILSVGIYFGRDMRKTTPSDQLEKRQGIDMQLQKGPFNCPAIGLCTLENIKASSMSAKLRSGSAIYAAYDGVIKEVNRPENMFVYLVYENEKAGLRSEYFLARDSKVKDQVTFKKGDTLATVSAQVLPIDKKSSILFRMMKLINDRYTLSDLAQEEFK